MEEQVWTFLAELVTLLAAALLLGAVMERLKQSAIVGYLLAGTVVGPNGLGLIDATGGMGAAAELGVSLLLFAIGLEFSVKRLISLGPIGLGGGTLQVIVTIAVGFAATVAWVGTEAAITLGAVVAMSSTACVLRVLTDRSEVDTIHGRNSVGILLLQDIAVVPMVLLVTMLTGTGTIGEMAWGMFLAIGLIVGMVVGFYLLSFLVVNRLLGTETLIRNRELSLLVAVVLAIGSAGAAHALKLSPALGAFLAGMLLAESPFASRVRADVGALRTLFVTLFFATVGMLGDPLWIAGHWALVLAAVGVIIVGKSVVIAGLSLLFGYGLSQAVATGVCLAQVGEFSFVLAGIARNPAQGEPVIDDDWFKLIVSATLVTLVLTPYLVALATPIGRWAERKSGGRGSVASRAEGAGHGAGHGGGKRVVLIGYGPAGQRVAEHAKRAGYRVTVLELHPKNVQMARAAGFEAKLGDATHGELLEHAHIGEADAVVIALPDHGASAAIAEQVRAMSATIPIIARARYSKFVGQIASSGATAVVDEEVETGWRMGLELTMAVGDEGEGEERGGERGEE